jgi:hypothetical protein
VEIDRAETLKIVLFLRLKTWVCPRVFYQNNNVSLLENSPDTFRQNYFNQYIVSTVYLLDETPE